MNAGRRLCLRRDEDLQLATLSDERVFREKVNHPRARAVLETFHSIELMMSDAAWLRDVLTEMLGDVG